MCVEGGGGGGGGVQSSSSPAQNYAVVENIRNAKRL